MKPEGEKEDFKKALEKAYKELGVFWPDLALRPSIVNIAADLRIRRLLEKKIAEEESSEGYHVFPGSFRFYEELLMSETEIYYSYERSSTKTDSTFSEDECIQGLLKISKWEVDSLYIRYGGNDNAEFFLKYRIFLERQTYQSISTEDALSLSSPLITAELCYWSRPITVPLIILGCWMSGKLEDGSKGIVCNGPVNHSVRYNSGRYPKGLWDLFSSGGEKAFDLLLDARLISRENYLLVTRRLQDMGICIKEHAADPFQAKNQQSADIRTEASTEHLGRLAAIELSKKDRKRLVEISKVDCPLSFSKWGEHLKLSKGAAWTSFRKLEHDRWLNALTITPDGCLPELSEKGRAVVDACKKDPKLLGG